MEELGVEVVKVGRGSRDESKAGCPVGQVGSVLG